jgi:stage II sporulation protein AB (anti-sigma F factor)
MNKPCDKLKLEFESKSVNEGFARAAVGAFAARLDPSLEELNDIKTAVSEAVTNCIVHAYPDGIGPVYITVKISANILEIRVKDCGRGIEDIQQAREPLYTTGGDDRSGMGFTVMESFCDGLRVKSKPGAGTTVVLTKRIKSRR